MERRQGDGETDIDGINKSNVSIVSAVFGCGRDLICRDLVHMHV